jgi:hypothetical protein
VGNQVRPKAKLKWGWDVAKLVASGEAETGVHQMRNAPLPAEVQNATVHSAEVVTRAKDVPAAKP